MVLRVERRTGGEVWTGPAVPALADVVVGDMLVFDGVRLYVVGRVVEAESRGADPAELARLTLVVDETLVVDGVS